jgi:tetratricopeptide (TPR) repeat protein
MFAAAAAGEWLRLESPDFELYTAAGARTGRDILARLEQARHVFATSVPGRASALPVRVFVFRSAADFAPYNVRAGAAGYFAPGPDRDIIAMQAGASDLHRVVLHEFVHLLMRNTDWAVPAWLNEGTAELFSTLRWSGARLTAGEAVPSRVAALRSQPLLDIRTLLAVDGHSPHYNETEKAGIFYAQSWALVHMLNFSPKYRDKTPQFMKHIASGIPAHDAFSSAYRLPLAIIGEDLRAYVRSGRFAGQSFEIPPAPTTEDVRVSAVSDVQAALLSIDLLVDIGRAAEAEAMLTRLAARHGSRADVQQALGDAAARRREFTVAGEHYRRARAMGSRTGRLLYDMALVQRELGADDASLQDALAEALALDPTLFDAHFLLGHIKLKSARCRRRAAMCGRISPWLTTPAATRPKQRPRLVKLAASLPRCRRPSVRTPPFGSLRRRRPHVSPRCPHPLRPLRPSPAWKAHSRRSTASTTERACTSRGVRAACFCWSPTPPASF